MVKLAIFSVFALCAFKSISCERVEFGDCGESAFVLRSEKSKLFPTYSITCKRELLPFMHRQVCGCETLPVEVMQHGSISCPATGFCLQF